MKKVLYFILGVIAFVIALPIIFIVLALCIRVGLYLLCLLIFFFDKDDTPTLDETKIDTTYFLGEYEARYKGETEKIILKENMCYDYINVQKKDTLIDVGEWYYHNNYWLSVDIINFPNKTIMKDTFWGSDFYNIPFSVHIYGENMGDLIFVLDEDSGEEYTFVKLEKGKNKFYIKKDTIRHQE